MRSSGHCLVRIKVKQDVHCIRQGVAYVGYVIRWIQVSQEAWRQWSQIRHTTFERGHVKCQCALGKEKR